MNIYKICTHAFGLSLILLRLFISTSKHKHILIASLRLFWVPIYDSGYLFIQNPIMNVGFFGMEIFVEWCPDHAVAVDGYAVLLGEFV